MRMSILNTMTTEQMIRVAFLFSFVFLNELNRYNLIFRYLSLSYRKAWITDFLIHQGHNKITCFESKAASDIFRDVLLVFLDECQFQVVLSRSFMSLIAASCSLDLLRSFVCILVTCKAIYSFFITRSVSIFAYDESGAGFFR